MVYGHPNVKILDLENLNTAFNNVYRHTYGVKRGVSISCIFANKFLDTFNVLLRKSVFNRPHSQLIWVKVQLTQISTYF